MIEGLLTIQRSDEISYIIIAEIVIFCVLEKNSGHLKYLKVDCCINTPQKKPMQHLYSYLPPESFHDVAGVNLRKEPSSFMKKDS